jgi:hypothetical protein
MEDAQKAITGDWTKAFIKYIRDPGPECQL